MTDSFPDKQMFQALEGRVSSIKLTSPSVLRLRDSLPDSIHVVGGGAATLINKLRISEPTGKERLLSEIRIQVPAESVVPSDLTVRMDLNNSQPLPVLAIEIVTAGGATWLSLHVLTMLSAFEAIWLNFAAPYSVLLDTSAEANADYSLLVTAVKNDNTELSGTIAGVHLVTGGNRNILGRIAPDAFPTSDTATPNLANGAVELVLEAPPYLRTMIDGAEYRLVFAAAPSGGDAT